MLVLVLDLDRDCDEFGIGIDNEMELLSALNIGNLRILMIFNLKDATEACQALGCIHNTHVHTVCHVFVNFL